MAFASLEWVTLPSFESEFTIVAHLYSYCDESGKEHSHDIVVFNALVDSFKNWEHISELWMGLLRQYQLTEFHAVEALRHSQTYGAMKPGTADQRAADVLPFVRLIVENLEFGVIGAIHVRAYKLPTLHKLRLNVSEDPHYFAFYNTIATILQHWTAPREYTTGLILDDDEEKAIECYKFLGRMKRASPEVRRRIPSICFMNDSQSPQLQAVDLFTYLCRIDAERMFLNKPNPYNILSEQFNRPSTGKAARVNEFETTGHGI